MPRRFVSYLKVNTDRQGRSGLGLEAQRAAVSAHLAGGAWTLLDEMVKVESDKATADRPQARSRDGAVPMTSEALSHREITRRRMRARRSHCSWPSWFTGAVRHPSRPRSPHLITLGQAAQHLATLTLACNRCGRRGRRGWLSVARLLAEWDARRHAGSGG